MNDVPSSLVKPLMWEERDCYYAESPSTRAGYLLIANEEGRYWGLWAGAVVEGHETLDEAKAEGQALHDAFILKWVNHAATDS